MGAALVAMVARLTIGKKKYAQVEDQMNEILNQAERLRRELSEAVEADAAAFEGVLAAFRLPKGDTPGSRNSAWPRSSKPPWRLPKPHYQWRRRRCWSWRWPSAALPWAT